MPLGCFNVRTHRVDDIDQLLARGVPDRRERQRARVERREEGAFLVRHPASSPDTPFPRLPRRLCASLCYNGMVRAV